MYDKCNENKTLKINIIMSQKYWHFIAILTLIGVRGQIPNVPWLLSNEHIICCLN